MTPEYAMARALELSFKALPACRPNPPVGCVILNVAGEIVASGYTQPPGEHHAEAQALAAFEGPLGDCHAYVTLEPCSFQGRTPSCAGALVARGIGAVTVSIEDPDPRNSGQGIAILREAGIPVVVGTLAVEVSKFLMPYLIGAQEA